MPNKISIRTKAFHQFYQLSVKLTTIPTPTPPLPTRAPVWTIPPGVAWQRGFRTGPKCQNLVISHLTPSTFWFVNKNLFEFCVKTRVYSSPARASSTAHRLTPEEIFKREDGLYGAHNYYSVPAALAKGKGTFVWDVTGKRYFDFLAAYWILRRESGTLSSEDCENTPRTSWNIDTNFRSVLQLCFGWIWGVCYKAFWLRQTFADEHRGVEGGETACKLARKWGYQVKGIPDNRAKIVFAENNFWGRTLVAVSSSSDPECYGEYGPYIPGFELIPYNDLTALEASVNYYHFFLKHTTFIYVHYIG